MADSNSSSRVSIGRLVLVPGLITLGVTILRLVGERQHWSKTLFNTEPGGPLSIIGIVWLAPIFGIYFAMKLAGAGEGPTSAGKAIGFAVLGLFVLAGGIFLVGASQFRDPVKGLGGLVLILAAAAIDFAAWPSLAKALLAYGYLARIPVAILMYFALSGHWGTHYDAVSPNLPPMNFGRMYFTIGLLPQLVGWVVFTMVTGSLFGSIAAAFSHKGKVATQAAS